MTVLKPFRLSSGGVVFVEVDEAAGVVRAGNRIDEVVDETLGTLQGMVAAPNRVELTFGVSMTAEASAVIAKVGASANMTVTVVWERPSGDAVDH